MDEPLPTPGRTWPLLLVLLLLTLAMRVWQVKTSEVAARDCISYVRIAWRLEHDDWRKVIPNADHHPAYPLAILVTSLVVRTVHTGPLPDVMQASAQLASSIASILLVVPMFFLGREQFDRRVAFWATLLFQCLPSSGRLLADGLSESLFLLFAAMALWLAVVAFRRRSPWCFAGVGLFGSLAYLTRPEGALIVAATGVVLAALQMQAATRRSWPNFAASVVALTVAALMLAGPFMILIKKVTTKNTGNTVLQVFTEAIVVPEQSVAQIPQESTGAALQPALFAAFWENHPTSPGHAEKRLLWAPTTLLSELCKLFFYVLWVPLLLGLWLYRDRFQGQPVCWVMALSSAGLLVLLYRVALEMGYLSDRHAVLILCCSVYWIVAGLLWAGERCASFLRERSWLRPGVVACLLVGLACAAGLVRTLEPMHSDRAGFREAGHWLANHAEANDFIDDPYTWSSYFAGRYFTKETPCHEPGKLHCVYVVLEYSSNKHPDLANSSDMDYVFKHGDMIQSWPVRRRHETAEIRLYKVVY